jgi:hypothetical protein
MATDQSQFFKDHPYIQKAEALNQAYTDRKAFHKAMEPVLMEMADDREFMLQVIERNFTDLGWLKHDWSDYNIPFFYVYESDDMIIKVHLFPAGPEGKQHMAAHPIHHHNNYLLTTYAFFGSGYESLLFGKQVKVDEKTKESNMEVTKHFHQKDWNPSLVDSWEPHIVFLPEKLSATFLMWSPDTKRKTDKLRNNGILKPFKKELRHLIYRLGMGDRMGIAREKTYQWYVDEGKVMAIEEEEYFAPFKAANGPEQKDYAMRMIFSFLQQSDLVAEDVLRRAMEDSDTPDYYKPFIQQVLDGETVEEVLHRYELNIPNTSYTREDILSACKVVEVQ